MPTETTDNFWDGLSQAEGEFVEAIIADLDDFAWSRALIDQIRAQGGVTGDNKALLFELRFGYALHLAGISPSYEIAGEGNSTIDFGFQNSGQSWAVELMRLEETAATRGATTTYTDEDGIEWSSRTFSSRAEDARQSEEGETLKAVQRICQKLERNGQPHKFQPPAGQYQAILVDFRQFLPGGGDVQDMVHIGLGGEFVSSDWHRRYWEGILISGVFNERTTVRGAAQARERIHFLGFADEQDYTPGQFASSIRFFANPFLFQTANQVSAAIATWPLHPMAVLNHREEL